MKMNLRNRFLVRQAIEEKLQREQNVAAERFQTEIIQERAQQAIEALIGLTPDVARLVREDGSEAPPSAVIEATVPK